MNFDLQTVSVVVFLFLAPGLSSATSPAQVNEGRVTAIFKNVNLSSHSGSRPARLNDRVEDNAILRTGDQSRAELSFADQSVVRLWARTIISRKDSARNLYLEDGAAFLRVPRGAVITTVIGPGVAADISGTSVLFQCHSNVFKFLVLEGTARLYRPDQLGESVLVSAGQLVFGNPKAALSDPVDFDINHFLKTSRFITDFGPLRGGAAMAADIQKQQDEKSKKTLIETNLVLHGGGTNVSVIGPGKTGTGSRAPTKSPKPAPTRTPSLGLVNQSR